jgi:hypothetical protein
MQKETLTLRAILQGARLQKRLPKFLKDELEMYLRSTGQSVDEAINNLKQ